MWPASKTRKKVRPPYERTWPAGWPLTIHGDKGVARN